MADAGAMKCNMKCNMKCPREWNAIFQKSLGKLSSKCYRSFLLDLAAIFLGLKLSLLFDYALIDSTNASILIEALATEGLIPHPLDVLKVGDDIFFADLKDLLSHLKKSVEFEELTLIDVSGKLQEPRVLPTETLKCVKKQFSRIVEILEQKLKHVSSKITQMDEMVRHSEFVDLNSACDNDQNWCVPCVFGFLLGYPVIYWYDQSSEYNCLNMVPLNHYTVTLKASASIFHSRMLHSTTRLVAAGCEGVGSCGDHTVFSFTAPVSLESHYESKVSRWIKNICDMGEALGIGEHLTVKKTMVTYTQLTL